ncbi:hypothetical protein L6452_39091 [Arctium lappa]|uniref:Uncharacterized protein n=1 Tax=Arctium lappa TaxID=4217 RepID=A0ACB8XRZ9_ARCLA|nr:hypothetical protein L6452_39091 [Arctium lappa]
MCQQLYDFPSGLVLSWHIRFGNMCNSSEMLFEYLSENSLTFPVLHHVQFSKGIPRDDLVISAGANVGALLVDGRGDVNGPWEMVDADFGYVGGALGKIDLYVEKTVVKRGIAMENATDALIELIKEHGRWVDPPVEE